MITKLYALDLYIKNITTGQGGGQICSGLAAVERFGNPSLGGAVMNS